MPAAANDYFSKAYQRLTTTLSADKLLGASAMTLSAATNWPTDTGVKASVYNLDANGDIDTATLCVYKGTVSGSNITNLALVEGTDRLHSSGATVSLLMTATHWNDAMDGILVSHNQDGTLKDIVDANGNERIRFTDVASAVNEITVTNAIAGTRPFIQASGNDATIGLDITSKGVAPVVLWQDSKAARLLAFAGVSSAVNYLQTSNSGTGVALPIAAVGTDTNISISLNPKGTGEVQLNGVAMSGAWQSYTPTFANTTLGNGSVSGSYKQIGKTVFFRAAFVLGTTSAVGSNPTVSLPVTSVTPSSIYLPIGQSLHFDNSGGVAPTGYIRWASTTTANIGVNLVSGSYVNNAGVNLTVPFTWAVNDAMLISGSYEAA